MILSVTYSGCFVVVAILMGSGDVVVGFEVGNDVLAVYGFLKMSSFAFDVLAVYDF